jgi:hypothetical protein
VVPTAVVPTAVVPTAVVPTAVVPTAVVPTAVVPTAVVPTAVVPTAVVPTAVVESPTAVVPTIAEPSMASPESAEPSLSITGVPLQSKSSPKMLRRHVELAVAAADQLVEGLTRTPNVGSISAHIVVRSGNQYEVEMDVRWESQGETTS